MATQPTYQFEHLNRPYPVSAETRIDFADYKRMHTQQHVGSRPHVPPFSQNDKQLQRVLLVRAWLYVHGGNMRCKKPIPNRIDRAEIDREATAKAIKGHTISENSSTVQHEMIETHRAAVQRAGSYLSLQASVAYRAWREGQSSVGVAESLNLTPWSVRQKLWRLRRVAKELGYDVGPSGHTSGMKFPGKRK